MAPGEKHWLPRGCDPPCRATEGVLHPWSIPWPRRAFYPRQFLLLTHHIGNFPQNIGLFPQQVRVSPQTQVFPQQICASPCFPSENLPFPSADPRLSSVAPYFSWDLHLTRVDPHLPSAEPRFPLARPLGTIPGATLAALHPHGRAPEGPQPPVPPSPRHHQRHQTEFLLSATKRWRPTRPLGNAAWAAGGSATAAASAAAPLRWPRRPLARWGGDSANNPKNRCFSDEIPISLHLRHLGRRAASPRGCCSPRLALPEKPRGGRAVVFFSSGKRRERGLLGCSCPRSSPGVGHAPESQLPLPTSPAVAVTPSRPPPREPR